MTTEPKPRTNQMTSMAWILAGFVALLATAPAGHHGDLAAQASPTDAIMELEIERANLEQAVADIEAAGPDAVANGDADRTRRLLELGRARLERGDFRPGDYIDLVVEGEEALTDTIAVSSGPRLILPVVGDVGLHGVLRSELQAHLTEEISRVILNPVVRARGLVRVSVLGEVARPGFYTVPPDAMLADALMLAGGPTQDARMEGLRVERNPEGFWHPDLLPAGPAEVQSVSALGLQTGDRVVIPPGARFTSRDILTYGLGGLSVLVTALAFATR